MPNMKTLPTVLMTMMTMLDLIAGQMTTIPVQRTTLMISRPPSFSPGEEHFFPYTTPPPGMTTRHSQTQGVAAPFDLNPYRTTKAPPHSPRTKLVIECPHGFDQISTPCGSPENGELWPECDGATLHVLQRFSVDGYESCLEAAPAILGNLGPYAISERNATTALRYPVATTNWWGLTNITNEHLLQDRIATALEEELNNVWSSRCADFIEYWVTCPLKADRNDSISTTPSAADCDGEYVVGDPDAFTPVWHNGSFLFFFNGTYIIPTWWSDRSTYDVVESTSPDYIRQDKTRELRVCGIQKPIINCDIIISEDEYLVEDVGNSTAIIYNGTEYQKDSFEYVPNNSVRICIIHDNFSSVEEQVEEDTTIKPVNVQLIYSHVLFAVSTLCLVLLVGTYLIFSELRNFQGCAILTFAVTLLISQICLQYVAPYARRTTALCQGVAVLAHFTLLCAFAWMTLLAFDLYRSFKGTQTRTHHSPNSRLKRYARYSLVGWGIPLLLVIVSLGLHFTENDIFPLEYGSGRNCWVYPVLANIILFISPIVLSLVANVVLFILTVINICRTTKMTRSALQQDRSHRHVISELLIYFKISCLMGFSWLFGLVAALGTTPALWYIFITVNGLQGISVFFSFGLNARVRKLWRKGMAPAKSGSSSGSSNKTKKTSSV
ncbi:G-protein coupled receptor Mth2-like [Lytechinus variegatus]|uniref:G-protein coupled receptor Mth2-like n=1 Tax=Lytechinus variegatus TaxID=7654 RepID=UPI001BB2660E|nr:G-protein coupled receptor Mth2-like [Lytechinus variegatus]